MKMIGRAQEQAMLQELLNSPKAEFLAVYGRRRIGKTFLIREYFLSKKTILFNSAGTKDGNLADQITLFTQEIARVFYNGAKITPSKNWNETFETLTSALSNIPQHKKIVLFMDELPWMATKNSKLLTMLDYYWNQHWSKDRRVKLIICGSSASWIVDKIINNKGGLHNRITKQICLMPFNLSETKAFLDQKGVKLVHNQIAQIYMVTGGVPYYLANIQKGLSATQNLDFLAFCNNGLLAKEFDNLFSSLFANHELSVELVKIIAQHKGGIGQEEIFNTIGGGIKGKVGLQKLAELESAGFIARFKPYSNLRKGIYYKVIDEYTLFYLEWIRPVKDTLIHGASTLGYWDSQKNTARWYAWAGLAFEAICYKHLSQIRNALNLDVSALPNTWRFCTRKPNQQGAQIDLLFDRIDDAITVCEIKFTNKPFAIDKVYAQTLDDKIRIFKEITKTPKQIFLAMISADGLAKSKYSNQLISKTVTLKDLFAS